MLAVRAIFEAEQDKVFPDAIWHHNTEDMFLYNMKGIVSTAIMYKNGFNNCYRDNYVCHCDRCDYLRMKAYYNNYRQ